MTEMTPIERDAVARVGGEPMLDQVRAWAAINSGTFNLDGLAQIAAALADAFAVLPGAIALVDPEPADEKNPLRPPVEIIDECFQMLPQQCATLSDPWVRAPYIVA